MINKTTPAKLQKRIISLANHKCITSEYLGMLVKAELYLEQGSIFLALKEVEFVDAVMQRFEKMKLKEKGATSE